MNDDEDFISKTEQKKDSKKIQAFGKKICALSIDEINSFNFEEDILIAIKEYKSIKSNVAKKRQTQYLGKLLRATDLTNAYFQMQQLENNSKIEMRDNHKIETWRTRLMSDKDALTELINQHPTIDIQKIRRLINNSSREQKESKPPKSFRLIFKYLKEHII